MVRRPIGTVVGLLLALTVNAPSTRAAGSALRFDGTDDYVSLPTTGDLQLVQTDFTIEAWVYSDLFASDSRIISGNDPGRSAYQLAMNGGIVTCDLTSEPYANINFSSVESLAPGSWHHLAMVREGTTVRLYIDGRFDSSATNPAVTYDGTMPEIRMGRRQGGCCPFHGDIDELRVWNYARSPVAIESDFRLPLSGTELGLVAYWTFDEGDGQLLIDRTTRGNNGRLGDSDSPDAADPSWIASSSPGCSDSDGDGYYYEVGCGTFLDCNDAPPTTYPGAPELCDGYDNDCDGQLDNAPGCERTCAIPGRSGPHMVLSGAALAGSPLVWTGSNYGVAWADNRDGNTEIYFARLDSQGHRIGSDIRVTNDPGFSESPDLVWTGSEYGVAWADSRGGGSVFFSRMDADGNEIGGDSPVGVGTGPSLVWDGSSYGLAWYAYHPGDNSEIHFRRLDAAGMNLGLEIQVTNDPAYSAHPSLVHDGSGYGVAWMDGRDGNAEIYFCRLDAAGNKVGTDVRVTSFPEVDGLPSLVRAGSEYGVAWQRGDLNQEDVFFTRLDGTGSKIGGDVPIGDTAGRSLNPSLGWTGSEYGIAWAAQLPMADLAFARIDAQGAKLGGDILIKEGGGPNVPALAWNGAEYGVAYRAQVGPTGMKLHFTRLACSCTDGDGDGHANCEDCDDGDVSTYPGAPPACDGRNNDCDDPTWPALPGTNETDDDGDGLTECAGDCDDTLASVYPGASQLCDGINNECNDASWPTVPASEVDDDSDTSAECQGDCNDADPLIGPGGLEVCNSIDDNCNGLVDEDALGVDTDADGIHNACDNCRQAANPSQLDTDQDHIGNSCDNCTFAANAGQEDADLDVRGDACDNCRVDYNPLQDDYDGDRAGDACDNCLFDYNPAQTDMDDDVEGDLCDLDDGLIYLLFHQPEYVEWQEETGFTTWNSYRGDLAILRTGGPYTQPPGSNALASRQCGLTDPWALDGDPQPGQAAFYLTTGVFGGESGLGTDSAGNVRPNANPCP